MDDTERQSQRTLKQLDELEKAEKEWGDRLQTMVEKEASFLKKVVNARIGSASSTNRIQEALADLTVNTIEDFLTGTPP